MLAEEFRCPVLHLPMGQSSVSFQHLRKLKQRIPTVFQDQAHLHNERISMVHLVNGKRVVEILLQKIGNGNST